MYCDRKNRDEAQGVVTFLRRWWGKYPVTATAGVVTFNQAQRDLILDLLEEESQADPTFGQRYQSECERHEANQDVGFFVKNLESVQGDERDVMIFSTTFGPDTQGRFARRFGPVGMEGGHRRLNVAVTRAKQYIVILGSMPIPRVADALAAGRDPNLTAAGYLQLYLAYAEAVSAGQTATSEAILDRLGRARASGQRPPAEETALEADVSAVLRGMGCAVERGIGHTGFRIDLGVLHPDPKKGFVLGINCDGGSWTADRSARVREVWRPGLLRRRGWKLHQVWSATWWAQRDREVQRLRTIVQQALA